MKFFSALTLLFALAATAQAGDEPIVFYTQLIRGTDQESPQEAHWRPLGPKLTRQLSPKFRWKHYWEVSRECVKVQPGKTCRVRLSQEREMELDVPRQARVSGETEFRLYAKGVLVRRSRQSLASPMSIMGGGRENDESWFVVVRRDRPSSP